jgi:hypothetical protein
LAGVGRKGWALRLLVCGDRNWTNKDMMFSVLDDMYSEIDTIIEGEQRGADKMAREWANSRDVPFLPFPAKWKEYGKPAGPIRNQQMIDEGKPDYVIAFHEKFAASKGTADMIRRARKAGIPYEIHPKGE